MSVSKDKVEARAFQIFWKCFVEKTLTKAEIDAMRPPNDPPDFEFDLSQKHIAMEHTRLENRGSGPLEPSHELAIKKRIYERFSELLQAEWTDMPPVTISIRFVSCRDIKPKDEEAVARGVLNLVRDRLNKEYSMPLKFFMSELHPVSSCLGSVNVTESFGPSLVMLHYGTTKVDESGLDPIQNAANTKEADIPRYMGKYDECWLLLDACGPDPSQWIEPSLYSREKGISTAFNRVFVVADVPENIFEISVHGAEAPGAASQ
jgi:hypothetical protein